MSPYSGTDKSPRLERSRQSVPLIIGFDMMSAGTGFSPTAGGMIRYYEGLLQGLCALSTVGGISAFVAPWNQDLAVPQHPKIKVAPCRGLVRQRPGRVIYEQTALPLMARHERVSVLLSTCNVRPFLWRGPSVVVLQSMQSFFLADRIGTLRRGYLARAVPRSLTTADGVIAVTETQRADAIRLFDLDPERIVAVHHGAPTWATEAARTITDRRSHLVDDGTPYVLTVSRLYGLKNHHRLIKAFAKVVADPSIDHSLVIAGGEADVRQSDLEQLAVAHGIGNRVRFLGAVAQEDLPALVAGADAIAYVSLYETFGLPVLEAFAFGRPLVTSDIGGTAEVAGDAAELVDPRSIDSIARGLSAILVDPELRRRLSVAGTKRVGEFTWARCAEGTGKALELAIERHAAG